MKKLLLLLATVFTSFLMLGQSTDRNYVYTQLPRVSTTNVNNLQPDQKLEEITYFDGLGRPIQSISRQAGGNKEDLITPLVYDSFGRRSKEYLPFARKESSLNYELPATLISELEAYYLEKYPDELESSSPNPFSEKQYEDNPLSRVVKQAAAGDDWKLGNGHEITYEYGTNTFDSKTPTNPKNDNIRLYKVSLVKVNNTYQPSLVLGHSNLGFYGAGELFKTIIKDENWNPSQTHKKDHTTEEFKDKEGRVILKRAYNNNVAHDTYYVYDVFGNLSFVLPPKSEPQINKPNAAELSDLCYQYHYDHKLRLVKKKLPGRDFEIIIYDILNRPVMTQNALQKPKKQWSFTKYDVYGRISYKGIYTHPTQLDQQSMQLYYLEQNTIDPYNANYVNRVKTYEERAPLGGYQKTYYTNDDFPNTNIDILEVYYYDNYLFDHGFINPVQTSLPYYNTRFADYSGTVISILKQPRGLATGSKIKVLNTNKWIINAVYYDSRSREVCTYSKNQYLNTVDKTKHKLDFSGNKIASETIHTKDGKSMVFKKLF